MQGCYDIVIIGAGPAGATFARLAAELGLRLALVDGRLPGQEKPCGGLLAPDAQKALARFDLTLPRDVLVDPQIFSVRTIDLSRGLLRYYPRHYINMDRAAFDAWLRSLVPPQVDRFCARLRDARRRADGIFALTLHDGQQLCTRYLVGADGAASFVRRHFFHDKPRHYVSIQQWFAAPQGATPFYSCIFDPATSDSCSWTISKNGHLIYGGCFPPGGCRAAFEAQKQRLMQRYALPLQQPLKTEACLALSPRSAADVRLGHDGIYLLGEAAGFISTSSFEGISWALNSAYALYRAFAAAPKTAPALTRAYRRSTRGLRVKLRGKMLKHRILYHPRLRAWAMASGLQSLQPHLPPKP